MLDRQARAGEAQITIDTDSVNSGVPDFDKHLESKDFFDVTKWREAKFTGTQFSFDGDKVTGVDGTLTLLGKTHPVALKAEVCGGDFETTIRRSQWGMHWGIDKGIPDQVRLTIQIEAARQ